MMKTADGWKIIEVGPRIGGYRHELYALSHSMNHIMNDILNRAGEKPEIPAKPIRHAAIYKTYGRQEGVLASIGGLDAIQRLPSYVTMKCPFNPGDDIRFASNNGDAVIEVTLCHEDPDQLKTDIQAIESLLKIQVRSSSENAQLMQSKTKNKRLQKFKA